MLDRFNDLPSARCVEELLTCCAAAEWAHAVAAKRPYRGVGDLVAESDAVLAELPWAGVAEALAAHPRIGQRPTGDNREAAWSRQEQSGVRGADAGLAEQLAEVNRAYEARFGHLLLIFASGRGAEEILAAARARLAHAPRVERDVVRQELRKIVGLRLRRLVGAA